jgi:predicted ATPase/signal transduction histidine kinase
MTRHASYRIIETLAEGPQGLLQRAMLESPEGAPTEVLLKVLPPGDAGPANVARLVHECSILESLSSERILALAPETFAQGAKRTGRRSLCFETFSGRPLHTLLADGPLPVAEALRVGIALSQAIADVHQASVVHKDIQPRSVLYDRQTGQLRLMNFAVASRLSRENPAIRHVNLAANLTEGSLAYMSPEQTGRMNRSVDYRTDLYSLGVTLFELLTGELPFVTGDRLEFVHALIARPPPSPSERNPAVPEAVSSIVLKLLAKTAEERYQSAFGIQADLERCLAMVETGAVTADFTPGADDDSGQLRLPEVLYGRDQELEQLMRAFDRTRERAGLVLVSGASGVGKSSLVYEVNRPVVERQGYFAAGKFDQLARDIPFASPVEAFADLLRQILTEDETRVRRWKARLVEALGTNGQVIVDVLPELELIVGPQAPVPELGPNEARQRFARLFTRFVHVFCAPEHPLVLFLDDLQWADTATLELIEILLADADARDLLIIGAYRDQELDEGHPLMLRLAALREAQIPMETIMLQPLGVGDLVEFVAETLRLPANEVAPLAQVLHGKTAGNPFFVGQLIESLESNGQLRYDDRLRRWSWNLDEIREAAITDNVVELVSRRLETLPETSCAALCVAACIGPRFDLDLLARLRGRPFAALVEDLWPALREGMVIPVGEDYERGLAFATEDRLALSSVLSLRFVHDRIQQAAYALLPADTRVAMHLNVGRIRRDRARDQDGRVPDEGLFEIVDAMNTGIELLDDEDERLELAELDLRAGNRAREATAYGAAVKYLRAGLQLVGEQGWRRTPDLTRRLHVASAKSLFLRGDKAAAAALAERALAEVGEVLHEVEIRELLINFHISDNNLAGAIEVALETLAKLDIDVRAMPDDMGAQIDRFHAQLEAKDIDVAGLARLPELGDPVLLAALRIMMNLSAPAFISDPALWQKDIFKMVELCIEHGNSPTAAFAYTYVGNMLTGALDALDEGYTIGKLSVEMASGRFHDPRIWAKINVPYNLCIRPFKQHLRASLADFFTGIQVSLDVGDLEFACFNAVNYASVPWFLGDPLGPLEARQRQIHDMCRRYDQRWHMGYMGAFHQATRSLLGESDDPLALIGDTFDEREALPELVATKNLTTAFTAYLLKCQLAVIFGAYNEAVTHASAAREAQLGALGFCSVPVFTLFDSIARLLSAPDDPEHLAVVSANQAKLGFWAEHAPANYRHRHELVEAVLAGAQGRAVEAIKLYESAIEGAAAQGYVNDEALGSELAARYYDALGTEQIAALWRRRAHDAYGVWGASAKVRALEERWPELRATSQHAVGAPSLDLEAMIRSSQALSKEIVLDALLIKLMRTVLENAGAQRGFLLLQHEGRWEPAVGGSVDGDSVEVTTQFEDAALSHAIVNYVARSRELLVLGDASREGRYTRDPYVIAKQPRSVLCVPLVDRGTLSAVLYLENNLSTDVFVPERIQLLTLLSGQAAISIENARLYERLDEYNRNLEGMVRKRTIQLQQKNDELSATLARLEATQAQIIAQEKLASLGSLTAGVAHELLNPLNFINNFSSVGVDLTNELLAKLGPPGMAIGVDERTEIEGLSQHLHDATARVRANGQRAATIVQEMLALSNTDVRARESTNLAELVRRAVSLVQHRDGAEPVAIEQLLDEELGELEVHVGELLRALVNLLDNAVYATRERSPAERKILIRAVRQASAVHISVEDNGEGIPKAAQARIFEPFFTTKPTGEGIGLGLAIVHDIVQLHRGRVDVTSEPGGPTKVRLTLPTST